MPLDFTSILVGTAAGLITLSFALPWLMRGNVSQPARYVRYSFVLQGLMWAVALASEWATPWPKLDIVLSTLAMLCGTAWLWCLYGALQGWLGPRPGRNALRALALAGPLGTALLFPFSPMHVTWANLVLAAMGLIVLRAALWPSQPSEPGWRWVLVLCLGSLAALSLLRGGMDLFTDLSPGFTAPTPVNIALALVSNVTALLGSMALVVAWREEAEQMLRQLVLTDSLTGLLNRRGFEERANTALAHARRHGLSLSAMVLDLDHFKHINDTHGHHTGDHALVLFAQLLQAACRTDDVVARMGGEEFAVLMLHNHHTPGPLLDTRLREALAARSVQELGFAVDYSAGMATLSPNDTGMASLMTRADMALYAAKAAGRGRLLSAD